MIVAVFKRIINYLPAYLITTYFDYNFVKLSVSDQILCYRIKEYWNRLEIFSNLTDRQFSIDTVIENFIFFYNISIFRIYVDFCE